MFIGPKSKMPAIFPGHDIGGESNRRERARIHGLTRFSPQNRLPFDIEQVWDAGKAVRIGHGPATVIGETP